jgi:hypothetical protein
VHYGITSDVCTCFAGKLRLVQVQTFSYATLVFKHLYPATISKCISIKLGLDISGQTHEKERIKDKKDP